MAHRNLPGSYSTKIDGGLRPAPTSSQLNDRIVIFGTAADGPVYEPVSVDESNAISVFGHPDTGTLVKGVYEALQGTRSGNPDIVCVRLGGIYGTSATLTLNSNSKAALTLTAKYPNDTMNSMTVRTSPGGYFKIYNPYTGEDHVFTYDVVTPYDTTKDARNVYELAAAINADPDLKQIVVAEATLYDAHYEFELDTTDWSSESDIAVTSGYVTSVNIKSLVESGANWTSNVETTNDIDGSDSVCVVADAGNNLVSLTSAYCFDVGSLVTYEALGRDRMTLPYSPHDAKFAGTTPGFKTIRSVKDYDAGGDYADDGDDAAISEAYWNVRGLEITGNTGANGTETVFTFNSPGVPDDSIALSFGAQAGLVKSVSDTATAEDSTIVVTHSWDLATFDATTMDVAVYNVSDTALTVTTDYTIAYTDKDTVTVSFAAAYNEAAGSAVGGEYAVVTRKYIAGQNDADDVTNGISKVPFTVEYYDTTSGQWVAYGAPADTSAEIDTWTTTTKISTLTYSDETVDLANFDGTLNLTFASAPTKGLRIRVNFDTVSTSLTEASTLTAAESAADIYTYFVRGREIVFGAAQPWNIVFRTGRALHFELGSNITLDDAYDITLSFPDSNFRPAENAILGLEYTYAGAWPTTDLASTQTFAGGTSATNLSKQQMYAEIEKGLSLMRNYPVDIAVIMGAYIDDERSGYNPITGLPETINAGFHTLFTTWLDDVSENVRMCHGIMSIKSNTDYTELGKQTYISKATVPDLSDPYRAANFIPDIENSWLVACSLESTFRHPTTGSTYTASGEAALAGFISSLPKNSSVFYKPLPNGILPVWIPDVSYVEDMTDARIITWSMRPDTRRGVVSDNMTLAESGSDYSVISTSRIVKEIVDLFNEAMMPFVGEVGSSIQSMEAQKTAVNGKILPKTSGPGKTITKFDYKLVSTTDQIIRGDNIFNLYIWTVFNIRRIVIRTNLRRPDAVV